MQEIIIRKATITDLEVLLSFEQGIVRAERPLDPTLKEGLIHYYDIEAMITAPTVEIVVAELDGEVIGSGYARMEKSKIYLSHPCYAYLGFMYVKPEHRGKGINKRVIAALELWCTGQNVTELRLEVYNANQPAIKAYEKIGFAKHMIEMRKALTR